ncbi:Fez family zinc finger protein 1 [Orchesella cincta]|uniref:Fez family zinc finger protein 1 n=1 Tax=Orchesella cincta TaxID=48709 RepID=A0A1D2MFR6_ORCCI|nr:Fez family zinc finger protein 1 [Orchesella cincta]
MNPFGSEVAGGTRSSKRSRKQTALKRCLCCPASQSSSTTVHREHVPLTPVLDINAPQTFACKQCGKLLLSRQSLKRHLRLVHTDERAFACKFCDWAFKSRENLVRHLKTTHSKSHEIARKITNQSGGISSRSAASVSPKKMKRSALLVKRARTYQPAAKAPNRRMKKKNGKVFKCPECDAAFPNRKWFGEHLSIHYDVRPFSCRFCVWTFKRKDALYVHLQRKHGKSQKRARQLSYGAVAKNSYDMRDRKPTVAVQEPHLNEKKVVIPPEECFSPAPQGKPPVQKRDVHVIVGGLKFSTPRIILHHCDREPVVSRPKQGCETYEQWFWKDYCKFVDEMNSAPLIKTEPEYEMTLVEMAELLLK